MPQVQQTVTISIDDKTFEVASMTQEVKDIVTYMDEWRQKEADLASELLMVRAAIHDIQNTLLETIQGKSKATEEAVPDEKPKRTAKKAAK